MGINLNEIRDPKTRAAVIEADAQQNAAHYALGGLPAANRKPYAIGQPATGHGHEKAGAFLMVISLVVFRHRPCDDDNLQFGCKWLRDSVAATLGLDDADKRIKFQYGQIVTRGKEGVLVTIESL